jgi:hypothetical protein
LSDERRSRGQPSRNTTHADRNVRPQVIAEHCLVKPSNIINVAKLCTLRVFEFRVTLHLVTNVLASLKYQRRCQFNNRAGSWWHESTSVSGINAQAYFHEQEGRCPPENHGMCGVNSNESLIAQALGQTRQEIGRRTPRQAHTISPNRRGPSWNPSDMLEVGVVLKPPPSAQDGRVRSFRLCARSSSAQLCTSVPDFPPAAAARYLAPATASGVGAGVLPSPRISVAGGH